MASPSTLHNLNAAVGANVTYQLAARTCLCCTGESGDVLSFVLGLEAGLHRKYVWLDAHWLLHVGFVQTHKLHRHNVVFTFDVP